MQCAVQDCDTDGFTVPIHSWDRAILVTSRKGLHDADLEAVISATAYVTLKALESKVGSASALLDGLDDDHSGQTASFYADLITNATSKVNGYLASVYPIPLIRRGTAASVLVSSVDSSGAITGITLTTLSAALFSNPCADACEDSGSAGYYLTAPTATANAVTGGVGTGCTLTGAFNGAAPFSLTATPTIVAAGLGYAVGDKLIFRGGTSYVPEFVQNAALIYAAFDVFQRRITSDEARNPLYWECKRLDDSLESIRTGMSSLDARFPKSVSPGAAWVTPSRINASSL